MSEGSRTGSDSALFHYTSAQASCALCCTLSSREVAPPPSLRLLLLLSHPRIHRYMHRFTFFFPCVPYFNLTTPPSLPPRMPLRTRKGPPAPPCGTRVRCDLSLSALAFPYSLCVRLRLWPARFSRTAQRCSPLPSITGSKFSCFPLARASSVSVHGREVHSRGWLANKPSDGCFAD